MGLDIYVNGIYGFEIDKEVFLSKLNLSEEQMEEAEDDFDYFLESNYGLLPEGIEAGGCRDSDNEVFCVGTNKIDGGRGDAVTLSEIDYEGDKKKLKDFCEKIGIEYKEPKLMVFPCMSY